MENQKSNSKLKAVIIVLSLLLVASLAYLFKVSTDKSELSVSVENLTTEKSNLLTELEALKLSYESAMSENTTISGELAAEREKILELIKEVEAYKGDVASLQKYKNQFLALESKNKKLIVENEKLVRENLLLSKTVDSTKVVLESERTVTKALTTKNEELAKTVEAGSKLSIVGLNTVAYKVKKSGLEIETEKARVADRLKITFSIAENNIAQTGDRQYYVQVLDPSSNVLGDR
jgi:regulator of replication initiation timing